jgi:ferredoxin hydrogenase
MTCPVGCVSGGGQPKLLLDSEKEAAYDARINATYYHDAELPLRKSHENPDIQRIYDEYLGEPNGKESHHILHTHYCSGANNFKK